jgi:hypothetical protein
VTDRKTQQRRLERAGFVHVSAWVPAAYAQRVMAQAETYRAEVEALKAEESRPRGWPKGKPRKVEK